MAKWWKDRDDWLPGNAERPPRHDHDSDDDSQIPTEDIGDVDDESHEFDDVELPDRGEGRKACSSTAEPNPYL